MIKHTGFAAVTLGALSVWAAAPATAQLQEPDFTVQAERLGEGLFVLIGRGGNIGVSSGADGTFIIDDQYAPATPAINAALEQLGVAPVRFVLNTHWHGDHTGGNENYAKAGAVIVAHENARARMSTPQRGKFRGQATPASPQAALPVITFAGSVSLYLNGHRIRALHAAPAHTDGDVMVYFEDANVLHAGDLLFNGLYPFIDPDSGGSVEGLIAAVDLILDTTNDDTVIIPGHGPLSNRAAVHAYRQMLVETSSRVRRLMDDGMDVEQIVAAAPNADYDRTWAWGFITSERYLRMLVVLMGEDRE
jgi:glyoxylase-like metal-dependent hydrolase (beta-lactamase superfamily II)